MKFKSYIIIVFLAFFVGSCKESFLDINTNPNALPTASPNFVLTNALIRTAANFVGPNSTGSYWSGHWTQSNSFILSPTLFSYTFTNNEFNYWDGFYDNLYDYQYVIDNADAANQKFLKGPAKIMQAYVFHNLVDMYGNIPFTDALKGIKVLAPKFDDQKVVYESLITLLDQAIADCKANAFTGAGTGSDVVFKGNVIKWAKFGNSLKLRLLMHQARIAGRDTYIKTELNKIVTEGSGFITGEDVGAGGPGFFLPTAGKLNPIYESWGYNAGGAVQSNGRFPRMTAFLINTLKASNDTFRLKRLAYAIGGEGTTTPGVSSRPEVAANYVGVPFGIASGFAATVVSGIGPSQITKGVIDKPVILMTAAEVQFNLAEAKERYGAGITVAGEAKTYFEAGMTESFRILGAGVANAAPAKFTGIKDYDYAASTNKLNTIAYQKWLAVCNYTALEAWTEYRKTGYPVTPQSAVVPDSKRPLRLLYPSTELGSNGENVKAQGAIDALATRLFWDID